MLVSDGTAQAVAYNERPDVDWASGTVQTSSASEMSVNDKVLGDGLRIVASEGATILHGGPATFDAFAPGEEVSAAGKLGADGVFTAELVERVRRVSVSTVKARRGSILTTEAGRVRLTLRAVARPELVRPGPYRSARSAVATRSWSRAVAIRVRAI